MKLVKADLLDVRSSGKEIEGAVRIPYDKLKASVYELPKPGEALRVAKVGPDAEDAVQFLHSRGIVVQLEANFTYGQNWDTLRLWNPSPILEQYAHELEGKFLYEPGCGTGRNAVFASAAGARVIAADHLVDAIEKAVQLEAKYWPEGDVHWLEVDVDHHEPPECDVMLWAMYLPQNYKAHLEKVVHGGLLLIELPDGAKEPNQPYSLSIGILMQGLGEGWTLEHKSTMGSKKGSRVLAAIRKAAQ